MPHVTSKEVNGELGTKSPDLHGPKQGGKNTARAKNEQRVQTNSQHSDVIFSF